MKQEERESLIEQVLKVIQREKGNEDYNYYGDFFSECNKYHLTEKQFRQTVLRLAFERFGAVVEEDPELHIPNLNKFVDLFGQRCYNLLQLGRVLFEHPSKSEEYLEDVVFIKHDVTLLSSNSSIGLDISRLFKAETDQYNRFLRITYRLNNNLPFRVGNDLFQNILELKERAALDYNFHSDLANEYTSGHLQIWLEETNQKERSLVSEGRNYKDFLTFIYLLDNTYPFYLTGNRFFTPYELVEACKKELHIWNQLFQSTENGHIGIWLRAIGKKNWVEEISRDITQLDQVDYLHGGDKEMTQVQLLLQKIDPQFIPVLKPKTKLVSLTSIGKKEPFEQDISISLVTGGFVIAKITVDQMPEGVLVPNQILTFNSLMGHNQNQIQFKVNPSQLIRNKLYRFTILVQTVIEILEIKVELKVVFPLADFILENLKYVLLFAFLFGVSRALVGIEWPEWLNYYGDYFLKWEDMAIIPFNFYYFGGMFFIWILVLLLTTFWILIKNRKYGGE